MSTPTTAVYIGAGLDVRPIRVMKHIQHFIYIDSRPQTEQPGYPSLEQYDELFISDFDNKMDALGFNISKDRVTSPTCFELFFNTYKPKQQTIEYTHENKKQTLTYHFNTPFPQAVSEELAHTMGQADTLIIAGFHPHKAILGLMKKPVHVTCWEGTNYEFGTAAQRNDANTVVQHLHYNMSDVSEITYYKKKYSGYEYQSLADMTFDHKLI